MSKSKTKKALIGSAGALVLCFALLLGTTFAWFTDNAQTKVNKIQAGNLDIALEMAAGTNDNGTTKWVSAEGKTLSFINEKGNAVENALWEPGCTYYTDDLRIVNKGNLALKFKVDVTGLTGDAELNEAIDWGLLNARDSEPGSEYDCIWSWKNTSNEESFSPLDDEFYLLPGECVYMQLIAEMDEDAGNQYQGLSIDGIAITVYATQYTYEKDSTGDKYDKGATYAAMADVTKLTDKNISVRVYNGSSLGEAQSQALGAAYSFKTTEAVASEDYANYHADFVVKADKDIDVDGIMLAGWYAAVCGDDGAWIGFKNPVYDADSASNEIRLMPYVTNGNSVSYEELCETIKEFKCGVADLTGKNAGTTITVELRLYEVDETASSLNSPEAETGKYIVVGSYSYTF